MKVASILFKDHQIVKEKNQDNLDYNDAQLVIGFGSRELVSQGAPFAEIKRLFPNANIALCSTAGEIFGKEVLDDSLSLIATQFDSTQIVAKEINIDDYETSYIAGQSIVKSFSQDGLKLLFVISDGGKVNGSELIKGINNELIESVNLFDVYEGANVQVGKKSLAFSVRLRAQDKTLKTEEVQMLRAEIIAKVEKEYQAQLR